MTLQAWMTLVWSRAKASPMRGKEAAMRPGAQVSAGDELAPQIHGHLSGLRHMLRAPARKHLAHAEVERTRDCALDIVNR